MPTDIDVGSDGDGLVYLRFSGKEGRATMKMTPEEAHDIADLLVKWAEKAEG